MRKIKNPKIGEYLFCSRWCDADPQDPWCVGFVNRIMIDQRGTYVELKNDDGFVRWWPHFWRINKDEGEFIVSLKEDSFLNSSIIWLVNNHKKEKE